MRNCNICGWSGERFNVLFNERLDVKQETVCPICGSFSRQRVLYKFLAERFGDGDGLTCLEIAPHRSEPVQKALPKATYVSGDLESSLAMYKVDLTRLSNKDESVDLFVCSHVLEHIKDDVAAIREIYRVLRKGGIAVIQLPLGFKDDPGLKTVEFAEPRYYGHYRSYGFDVRNKLYMAGFHLEIVQCRDKRLVGDLNEMIFACKKVTSEHGVSNSSEQPLVSIYSSGSKRIKIAAITMVYNEALLLPYFLRHYEYLDEIYVLYETDSTDDTLKILKQASNVIIKNCHIEGGMDSIDKVNLINNALHTMKADWVYVVDCDEFIFPPGESPEDFLSRQDCENYNVVRAGMFQVYRHRTDKDLDPSLPPILQRVHGDPDLFSTVQGPNKDPNANYFKPIVVNPSSEIWFQPGNHVVEGDIKVTPELYLGAHWQMADPSIAIDRRMKNKARMSERNKKLGMGYQHWDVTEEWIRVECDRHLDDPLIEELELFSDKSRKNYDLLIMGVKNKAMAFELENQKRQLQELKAELEAKDARIANLETDLQELESRIQQIRHSIPMQIVSRYQRVIEKLLRSGTRRRRPYELMLSSIRVILNEGWKSFFRKLKVRLLGKKARANKQPQVTHFR